MTSNWSVPETAVLQRANRTLRADAAADAVLATVVRVEGNAYRRPGAKMLLDTSGGLGAITAGCLEEDLERTADRVRESGRPTLVTYDLMEGEAGDGEDVWGLGVGCNGVIDVLLEPLSATFRPAVDAFADGRDVAVLTVVEGPEGGGLDRGDRAYVHPDDGFEATTGDPDAWPSDRLTTPGRDLARDGASDLVTIETEAGSLSVFVDGLAAPPELVVFGSGHDVGPVTELAAKNDFRVTVVGFRGGVDLTARFPDADRTVHASPRDVGDLDLDGDTYTVVMTHNFLDDQVTVESLLDSPVPYVGLMGPTERFEELLEAMDVDRDDDRLAAVYAPVGLDLGGGSPYQIAHSIVAEALAVHNDREPGHLREREGHIHDRIDVEPE